MLAAPLLLYGTLLSLLKSPPGSLAYVPAVPANTTEIRSPTIADGGYLQLRPAPSTYHNTYVSYVLAGKGSNHFTQGALVMVTEDELTRANESTRTPWIAFINCDDNSTSPSTEMDIFTLAAQRGARAAFLYSNTSDECVVNPAYAQQIFNGVLDIFTPTYDGPGSWIRMHFSSDVEQRYRAYDASLLNASYDLVQHSYPILNESTVVGSGSPYFVASLQGYNATGGDSRATTRPLPTATASGSAATHPSKGHRNRAAERSLVGVGLMMAIGLLAAHL